MANELAQAFWPGGLTLVLEHAPSLAWDLGDAEGTVAVRLPDDDVARDLLRRTGPLAVSSANRSGRPAATSAQEAVEQLGDHAAVVLDGGPRAGSAASTIVDCTGPTPRVLRVGAIRVERLREVVPTSRTDGPTRPEGPEGSPRTGACTSGPGGSRAGATQRAQRGRGRHVAAVQSGGLQCHSGTSAAPPEPGHRGRPHRLLECA